MSSGAQVQTPEANAPRARAVERAAARLTSGAHEGFPGLEHVRAETVKKEDDRASVHANTPPSSSATPPHIGTILEC